MTYTIKAIIPPYVFVESPDRVIARVNIGDFVNSPRIGASASIDVDGDWTVLGSNTDPDCVGGVCPIK